MSKHKIYISKDRKNFFWIVVDRQKLILNPTEEDLKKTKSISYNRTNICPRCREEEERNGKELTDKSMLYPGNVLHDTDKNGKKVNEWVCQRHGSKHRNKYNSNSIDNLKKLLGNRRTHNQRPDDRNAFGDDCQECTCLWLGIDDLNKKNDNYTAGTPVDHSPIKNISIEIGDKLINLYGKTPQTRGKHYDAIHRRWDISRLENESYKEFDILILYCIDKDDKIGRIYIFPKEEISKRKSISIIKNSSKWIQWYEIYRVTEEYDIRKIDKIFQDIRKKRRMSNDI